MIDNIYTGKNVNKQLTVNINKDVLNDVIKETPTVVIGVRVPVKIYEIYNNLQRWEKKILRRAYAQLILQYATAKPQITVKEEIRQNVIVNVNIANAVAYASAKSQKDPAILEEKIKMLKAENKDLRELFDFWKKKAVALEHENALLKKKNGELEARIKELIRDNEALQDKVRRLEEQNDKLYRQLRALQARQAQIQ